MIRRVSAAALGLAATLAATPSPQPSPVSPSTAADVLRRVEQSLNAVKSYQVPVTIRGNVKVSFLSVPVGMDGSEYFRAPDQSAMHINNAPSVARGFENTMNSMGTPQTWEATYDIVLKGTAQHGRHQMYVLVGTPKHPANVKSVTMWVSEKTFSVDSVAFSYNNGATLTLVLSHRNHSPYHLPTSIAVDAEFPQYRGQATIQYGTYQINVPIADSVFEKQ